MDENHQDKTESKRTAIEDVRWEVTRKSKLWVPKHKKQTGFEGKTLWDWLDLIAKLAIPIVVLGATIGFGWWQTHLADVQYQQDQAIALDQQRAVILQTYIDNIQDLLLNHHLKSSAIDSNNPYYDVAVIAEARTQATLSRLDPKRKGILVQFLNTGLIVGVNKGYPVIFLYRANLTETDLTGAFLEDVYLSTADLTNVNLTNADLTGANLDGANLDEANLDGANLSGASLGCSIVGGESVSQGKTVCANLSGAKNLIQQQLDHVSSCDGASLPKGLTCH